MGEIIFSVCVGGFLVITGIWMNAYLRREEKNISSGGEDEEKKSL